MLVDGVIAFGFSVAVSMMADRHLHSSR